MSDAHHEHDGGHELEALDAGHLLRVIGGLTIVVFISIIAVIQWFHKQQAELRLTQSDYTFLAEHRAGEAKLNEGLEAVAERMASEPALLAAGPAPEGWIHPDDIGGGAGAGDAGAGAGEDAAGAEEGAADAPEGAGDGEKDGEDAEGGDAPAEGEGAATEGEDATGDAAAPAEGAAKGAEGEDTAEDSDQGSEDDADK